MQTVWKYPLEVNDLQAVTMPASAQLLHVETQHTQPTLWALVDPNEPAIERQIAMVGTGHVAQEPLGPYIGTAILLDGRMVVHVFDQGEGV